MLSLRVFIFSSMVIFFNIQSYCQTKRDYRLKLTPRYYISVQVSSKEDTLHSPASYLCVYHADRDAQECRFSGIHRWVLCFFS